jgi:hypothetical protein
MVFGQKISCFKMLCGGCSSRADVHAFFFANYPSIPCFYLDISVWSDRVTLSYPSIRTICIIDLGWARV